MTAFDDFARRGSRVFPSSQAKIAEPLCRAIMTGKVSINSEIDLQDEIYGRTKSLELASIAKGMWQHFTESTSLADWNTDVLKTNEERK